MRILLVHNHYGSAAPSGENLVFGLERDLLTRVGQEVRTYERHSDDLRRQGWLGTVRGAAATAWNPWSAAEVRRLAVEFRPDVVHAHNTFPLISPSIFQALEGHAARVLTLHNYRLFCPAAIPLRQGRTCTECLDRRSAWPAMRYGCYRGSRAATAPLALNVAVARARGTWHRHVEVFVALTEFQRDLVVKAGLPEGRVLVKPNFYPGRPVVQPWAERPPVVVYVGRLSEEKGVRVLLDAWLAWGPDAPPLRIVGDGPMRGRLEEQVRAAGLASITFLGQVDAGRADAEIGSARLLVVPSLWFEGFPLVLREAFARGTPAAVSDLGALPDLVEQGRAGAVFRAGDPFALLEAVRGLWQTPGALEARAAEARHTYEAKYSEDRNLATLLGIYHRAIQVRQERLARRGEGLA